MSISLKRDRGLQATKSPPLDPALVYVFMLNYYPMLWLVIWSSHGMLNNVWQLLEEKKLLFMHLINGCGLPVTSCGGPNDAQ